METQIYTLNDFQIRPNDKLQNIDLTMFTFVPDNPNDALQHTVQERIRLFNNSCLYLHDFYAYVRENYDSISKEKWDSENNRKLRQLFGLMYKELFTYNEKLVQFVLDILHIDSSHIKNEKSALREINKYSTSFDFIKEFVEKCNIIKSNDDYVTFRQIRDSEVHSNSKWDLINYLFENNGKGLEIQAVGYQFGTSFFYENLLKTIDILIELKRYIESFVAEKNILLINSICKISQ